MFGHVHEGKIYIFYGKMGSGKTTNAMKQVFDFHRRGQPVWVNFPLKQKPKGKSDAPIYYEDDPQAILSMRDGLFVLDEAYMTLNAREWAKMPKIVFTAFTHIRKLHMTVIVIAQSWKRIDVSIREVTSIARMFSGSSLFGRWYNFVEYEVDEMGDIIKSPPVEYLGAAPGFSIVRKNVYDAFDTDHLFGAKPIPKTWPNAVGHATLPPELSATIHGGTA